MAKRLHNPPRFEKNIVASQQHAAFMAVNSYFNDENKSKLWLETANPLLGNVSPNQMIKLGRYQKLINFIYIQISENVRV